MEHAYEIKESAARQGCELSALNIEQNSFVQGGQKLIWGPLNIFQCFFSAIASHAVTLNCRTVLM